MFYSKINFYYIINFQKIFCNCSANEKSPSLYENGRLLENYHINLLLKKKTIILGREIIIIRETNCYETYRRLLFSFIVPQNFQKYKNFSSSKKKTPEEGWRMNHVSFIEIPTRFFKTGYILTGKLDRISEQ